MGVASFTTGTPPLFCQKAIILAKMHLLRSPERDPAGDSIFSERRSSRSPPSARKASPPRRRCRSLALGTPHRAPDERHPACWVVRKQVTWCWSWALRVLVAKETHRQKGEFYKRTDSKRTGTHPPRALGSGVSRVLGHQRRRARRGKFYRTSQVC